MKMRLPLARVVRVVTTNRSARGQARGEASIWLLGQMGQERGTGEREEIGETKDTRETENTRRQESPATVCRALS